MTVSRPSTPNTRTRVVGVDVDPIGLDDFVQALISHAISGERLWVANHNLHSAYLVQHEPEMRTWYDIADLIFVDGMSLVAASRLGGGTLRRDHRITVLDWMPVLLDHAVQNDLRVFHLGGHPEWIERGADAWRTRHPGLQLSLHHGFFEPSQSGPVLDMIDQTSPHLLFVGMGMPRQEKWLVQNAAALRVPVVATVGAVLGYAAGATSTPPRWTGRVGLEWAWRLAADPRRLARRYLVEPVALARMLRRNGGQS